MQNELAFLSWTAFKRMAPAVVRLEIGRLGGVIRQVRDDVDLYNALVVARYELKRFVTCIAQADAGSFETTCVPHLDRALMILSLEAASRNGQTVETLDYIINRLRYVHDRIAFIY